MMFMATLGVFLDESLQRMTGLKNVLASAANGAAAVVFIAYGPIAWEPGLVLAGSSLLGGQLGAGLDASCRRPFCAQSSWSAAWRP